MDKYISLKKSAILVFASVLISFFLFAGCIFQTSIYETNSINDYGTIVGNYNNEKPKAFISSFFPEKLKDEFSNVIYHYKSQKGDTYAYEMYLEFVIEDKQVYEDYLTEIVGNTERGSFYYDSNYKVYIISNQLQLAANYSADAPPIDYAKIGLILFSKQEQRLIFVALGVYDGGGTTTDELNYFFKRFNIDPLNYKLPPVVGSERRGDGSVS